MNAISRVAVLAALLAASAARAESKAARGLAPAAAGRAALVRSLPQGATFTSRGESYRVLGGARAVPRAEGESEGQALARAGAGPADLIERKGAFLLFRDTRADAALPAPADAAGACPIAMNARTGRLAVVPGTLVVRLRKGADAAAVARAHGATLLSAAPRIRAAFLRIPPGQDLPAAAAALAKDPGVATAEVEVIEHLAVPH